MKYIDDCRAIPNKTMQHWYIEKHGAFLLYHILTHSGVLVDVDNIPMALLGHGLYSTAKVA